MKMYIIEMKHDSYAEADFRLTRTLNGAMKAMDDFITGYDFQYKDGKLFDPSNDDGKGRGFDCFDGVRYDNGKVIEFTHCGGDGPCARIVEVEEEVDTQRSLLRAAQRLIDQAVDRITEGEIRPYTEFPVSDKPPYIVKDEDEDK
jgi:hypothetical protein